MSIDEKEVFSKFILKCPYSIQINSIQKRPPPEPDILCKLEDGADKYFELVECVDASLAKSLSMSIGGFSSSDEQIWLEPFEKKFKKKYSRSCELLAYYDRQPIFAEDAWLSIAERFIKDNLKLSQFKKVWIYSVPQERILLTYPDEQGEK
jgi:hypothetical protein